MSRRLFFGGVLRIKTHPIWLVTPKETMKRYSNPPTNQTSTARITDVQDKPDKHWQLVPTVAVTIVGYIPKFLDWRIL